MDMDIVKGPRAVVGPKGDMRLRKNVLPGNLFTSGSGSRDGEGVGGEGDGYVSLILRTAFERPRI